MTLKQIIATFSFDTKIRIENMEDVVVYDGRLNDLHKIDPNLTVICGEIIDNTLVVLVDA